MIKTVASLELPVNEKLLIRKNVITPEQVTGSEKRFCVVTGTHGDELEGQYVCYELNRRIREQIHYLKGTVEIYPALNPLGLDTITRAFPVFDVDMNRIFPGTDDGSVAELVAGMIVKDLAGADMCIDVHASNIYIREIPQVRLNESTSGSLLKYAGRLNTEFVWVHHASTVLESTLATEHDWRPNSRCGDGGRHENHGEVLFSARRRYLLPDEGFGNLGRAGDYAEGAGGLPGRGSRFCQCGKIRPLRTKG